MDFLQAVLQKIKAASEASRPPEKLGPPAPRPEQQAAPLWFLQQLRMLADGAPEPSGLAELEAEGGGDENSAAVIARPHATQEGPLGRSDTLGVGENDDQGYHAEYRSKEGAGLGDYYEDRNETSARVGARGIAVDRSTSSKERDAAGNQTSETSSVGGGIGKGGAKLSSSRSYEIENDESGAKLSEGSDTSLSIGGGEVELKLGKSRGESDGTRGVDTKSELTVGSKGVGVEAGATHSYTDAEGKTRSHGQSTQLQLGKDKIEGGRTWTNSGPDGDSEEFNAGGNVDFASGKIGGQVGRTTKDKDGEVDSAFQASGGIDVGADGLQAVELGISVQKGPVTISLSGGTQAAAELQPLGDGYMVTWQRTTQGAAGGSAEGGAFEFGASGKAAHVERGARVFKTKEEAEEFRSDAANLTSDIGGEPTTASEALEMKVGEARGAVDVLQGGVEGKAKVTAGSFGAGASTTTQDGYVVARVDEHRFVVTMMDTTGSEAHGEMGTLGASAGGSTSSSHGHSVRVELDLGTTEGRAMYDELMRTGVPPEGAKVLAETATAGETDAINVKLGGASAESYESVRETVTHDEKGKHEVYEGAHGRDVDVPEDSRVGQLLGGGKESERFGIESRQENDADAGHTLSVELDTADGGKAYEDLAWTTGSYVDPAYKERVGKASGKWRLEVQMAPEEMAHVFDLAASGKLVRKDWSGEHDAIDALGRQVRMARRVAKATGEPLDLDAQMRLLSKYVAEGGPEALRTLEQFSGKSWDIALEGDENFAGAAGHAGVEKRIGRYAAQLEERDPTQVVGQLMQEQITVAQHRAALADPDRYHDLPPALRQAEVAKIDAEIAQLVALQNQAITSPGASVALAEQTRRRADGLDDETAAREAEIEELLVSARTYDLAHDPEHAAYARRMAAHTEVMANLAGVADARIAELRKQLAVASPAERDRLTSELDAALEARAAQLDVAAHAGNEAVLVATGNRRW